jgi:maleylacetate reductase
MATESFTYAANPARVVFGAGARARLPQELDRLNVRRALVLCTPEQRAGAQDIAALLGDRCAGIFDRAVMHVPVEVARSAQAEALRLEADGIVAFGGGSTTGLGKAIALSSPLPVLAVPTTYAGSEMTPIWGMTEGGLKTTGRDARVLPRTVIYDPELTLKLPLRMTVLSAVNAIAHAAEGLYAHDGNPVVTLMAEEGLRASAAAIGPLLADPQDLAARADALYGAWLCGSVLGSVAMGLHHKLCHTLGGSFNLPHAEVHAAVLPHAMAYNAAAAPHAMQRMARALGLADAAQVPGALHDLAARAGIPLGLKDLGMPKDGIARALDLALRQPYPNPRPLERDALRALLEAAFAGRRPA